MQADRITELTTKGDLAQAAVETLDQEISNALVDGVDDEIIAEMRRRRRELIEQSDDIGEALIVLQARAADPQEKLKAAIIAGGFREARRQADEYVTSAAAVDAALIALEKAFVGLRDRGQELRRALGKCGLDDVRLSNTLESSIRWALWRNSPVLSETMKLAHTPHDRRRPLRESMARLIPAIPGA